MKNFACTLSIVLSTIILSVSFPEHSPMSFDFLIGAALVLGATYLYGAEDAANKEAATKFEAEAAPAAGSDAKGTYVAVPAKELEEPI